MVHFERLMDLERESKEVHAFKRDRSYKMGISRTKHYYGGDVGREILDLPTYLFWPLKYQQKLSGQIRKVKE